jgi:hypothetical protein
MHSACCVRRVHHQGRAGRGRRGGRGRAACTRRGRARWAGARQWKISPPRRGSGSDSKPQLYFCMFMGMASAVGMCRKRSRCDVACGFTRAVRHLDALRREHVRVRVRASASRRGEGAPLTRACSMLAQRESTTCIYIYRVRAVVVAVLQQENGALAVLAREERQRQQAPEERAGIPVAGRATDLSEPVRKNTAGRPSADDDVIILFPRQRLIVVRSGSGRKVPRVPARPRPRPRAPNAHRRLREGCGAAWCRRRAAQHGTGRPLLPRRCCEPPAQGRKAAVIPLHRLRPAP